MRVAIYSLLSVVLNLTPWHCLPTVCVLLVDKELGMCSMIDETIGRLPTMGDEGINDVHVERVHRRQWVHRLVRITRAAWIGHAEDFLRGEMARCHVCADERQALLSYLYWSLRHADFTLDAPEQVEDCVTRFEKFWGRIPAPSWCRRPGTSSARLWLACLLYGAGGREFPFAEGRIASAFGIPRKNSVRSFLSTARKHGFLSIAREGSPIKQGGKPAYYVLAQAVDRAALSRLAPYSPLPPNEYNVIPFGEYVSSRLDWLNDIVNVTSR